MRSLNQKEKRISIFISRQVERHRRDVMWYKGLRHVIRRSELQTSTCHTLWYERRHDARTRPLFSPTACTLQPKGTKCFPTGACENWNTDLDDTKHIIPENEQHRGTRTPFLPHRCVCPSTVSLSEYRDQLEQRFADEPLRLHTYKTGLNLKMSRESCLKSSMMGCYTVPTWSMLEQICQATLWKRAHTRGPFFLVAHTRLRLALLHKNLKLFRTDRPPP